MHRTQIIIAAGLLGLLAAPGAAQAADSFKVDASHTAVLFRVKHLGFSYTHGRFNKVSGSFSAAAGAPSDIKIEIDAASLDSNDPKRDKHLRSPDFFNVKQFPKITFQSKTVTAKEKGSFEIKGELFLHGVKKEITVTAKHVGEGKDPWGGYRTGYELSFVIKRSEYGMKFMVGGIGDDVSVTVGVEGIRETAKK